VSRPALSQHRIDRMRSAVNTTLPDEIEILQFERVYVDGGYQEDWSPARTIPARVGLPLGGETDERAASRVRLADEDLYTIWIEAKEDVSKLDRIRWEGRTFEINLVLERGKYELTRRIRVREL